ncbi:hypothetical protein IQ227_16380 [Anabaena aphanizomenioides LEGE 00250]|jgi:hypothetical protein|uniref:HepT-like domain-containing protein n=1 Tax=Sphaerospermopsis aphanizomenoides LEGE 00250 TaxID=2777972 RepID=A0ABR9VIQ7_9CYAN|nr:hypothetical protein [Sphaerospermopsis aphanizomenoides]MBE9237557.1 hypothetical protein [Sphaerospermopsis aphanizomenoides LEGE 00250]
MEKNTLIIFQTDVKYQLVVITAINQKLVQRSENLTSDNPVLLESIAYQIHNLYGATEELLKIVASYFENYFENNITDTAQWHSALLRRMSQNIPEVRPFLISGSTYEILNSLRGFRHFFRHAYGVEIEYEQLKINLFKALALLPSLENDIDIFMEKIN